MSGWLIGCLVGWRHFIEIEDVPNSFCGKTQIFDTPVCCERTKGFADAFRNKKKKNTSNLVKYDPFRKGHGHIRHINKPRISFDNV